MYTPEQMRRIMSGEEDDDVDIMKKLFGIKENKPNQDEDA